VEHRAADAVPAVSLSQALEQEHREIDDAIKRCADTAVASPEAGADLERAVAELRWHIYVEEELLFPPLRAAGMTGPILVMLWEHGQMWPILDTLDQALRDEVDQGTLHTSCRTLLILLKHHNPKEEKILYPQVDYVLGEDASGAIREFLTGGRVPADWMCQHLRPKRGGG
jgi:regulator of cell morphogenesis and NO signaling